jgi:predicted XRE-type DNA-binding protein
MTVSVCGNATRKRQIEIEEGSGNVFADLGLKDADELFARAQIGFCVYKIVKARKLKQREIATLLGIAQPEVSHLTPPCAASCIAFTTCAAPFAENLTSV